MTPAAVVMNLAYTGLGIARSLWERGVRVVGLTSLPRAFGNATRCAEVSHCPDSRDAPQELLEFLLRLQNKLPRGTVVFPTRDDDVVFLNRYRAELSGPFELAIPPAYAVKAALDKQETYSWTEKAQVPSPRCWTVQARADVERLEPQLQFPCVLKPAEAYHWRREPVWETVGHRKAIVVSSPANLFAEYDNVARFESRALLQEFVPGGDQQLWIAACYLDRESKVAGAYAAQKLMQVPDGFGTGCILQAVERPDLIAMAARVLQTMNYQGLAEVEFKFDERSAEYKLIEINPRPWDQHRLGYAIGTDLIYAAYCDLAGLPIPPMRERLQGTQKWIAEDVLLMTVCRMAKARDPRLRTVVKMLSGSRTYGISSISDPMPLIRYLTRTFFPQLLGGLGRAARERLVRAPRGAVVRTGTSGDGPKSNAAVPFADN